ncbi:hypothetical protein RugamoR1_23770 [Rugamonas sp. R1(2021)]
MVLQEEVGKGIAVTSDDRSLELLDHLFYWRDVGRMGAGRFISGMYRAGQAQCKKGEGK